MTEEFRSSDLNFSGDLTFDEFLRLYSRIFIKVSVDSHPLGSYSGIVALEFVRGVDLRGGSKLGIFVMTNPFRVIERVIKKVRKYVHKGVKQFSRLRNS